MLNVHIELYLVIADKVNGAAVVNVGLVGVSRLNCAAVDDVSVVLHVLVVNFLRSNAELLHDLLVALKLEETNVDEVGQILLESVGEHLSLGLVLRELAVNKLTCGEDVSLCYEIAVVLPVSEVVALSGVRSVLSGRDGIVKYDCVAEAVSSHVDVSGLEAAVSCGGEEYAVILTGLGLHVAVVVELYLLALVVNL